MNEIHTIKLKPLSVNEAWQGKRFKTKKYKAYESLVMWTLPKELIIPEGNIKLYLEFGFSNKASDWDNPIKPFVDILQKKYSFDDKRIVEAHIRKTIVEKGKEYIRFSLS